VLPQRAAVPGAEKNRPRLSALLHRTAEKLPATTGLISGRINGIHLAFEKIKSKIRLRASRPYGPADLASTVIAIFDSRIFNLAQALFFKYIRSRILHEHNCLNYLFFHPIIRLAIR